MYLYSKRPLPIRAKKDIKCYKQLVIEGSDIKTPYINHLVGKAKWRFNDQSRGIRVRRSKFRQSCIKT
jgi:hypothetical protein